MANPTSVQQRDLPSSSVSLAFDWIDRDFAREKAKWPTTQWLDLVFLGCWVYSISFKNKS